MKKIIAITCSIATLAMLCTSCFHRKMSASKYYESYTADEEFPTLKSIEKINDLSKLNYKDNLNGILVFDNNTDNKKTKFYNPEISSFILDIPSEELKKYGALTFYNEDFFFTVESEEENEVVEYNLNLYDAKGTLVASQNIDYSYYYFNIEEYFSDIICDLFKFDGKVYRVNADGTAKKIIDNPFSGSIPTGLIKTNNYYYNISTSKVTVYNNSLEQVLYWEAPYSTSSKIFLLSGDHLLVQMSDVLPFDEKKYDYTTQGDKYDLTSIIIDVAKGKEKEVNLDFKVIEVIYSDTIDNTEKQYQNEDVENLAKISYIVDKRVNSNDVRYVALSGKNASVKFEIAAEFDSIPTPLGNGYYVYTSDNKNTYLLNSNFETVSQINGFNNITEGNDNFIVLNNKIYDYNLNLVYDLDANDKKLICLMANSFIIYDQEGDNKKYHLRTSSGSLVEIEGYYTSSSQYYVTRERNTSDNTYEYSFYNANGYKMHSVDDASETLNVIHTYDNNAGFIIHLVVDGDHTYYKLTK